MGEQGRDREGAAPRFADRLARAAPLLVLALVVALVAVRATGLERRFQVARMSEAELQSDEDLLRSEPVLGPEFPILAWLEREHPRGARVSLALSGAAVTRGERFWLALLPRYPIASDADLVICWLPCNDPELSLVARGESFALMRRVATGRGPGGE
jgi:hypothetical protein